MISQKINPIIIREIRSQIRRRRTFFGLMGYLIFLSLLVWGFYALFYRLSGSNLTPQIRMPTIQDGPRLGKSIFVGLTLLMLIIFPFTAVSFASDAIAGERERQTFDILRITTLRDRQIVGGKVGAVFIFILLYILITLPIQALAFLFGGVSLVEFMIATLALLTTGLAFGAFGVYISSIARSARVATALSSSVILLFVYGLPFIVWLATLFMPFLFFDVFNDPPPLVRLLLFYGGGFLASINPLGAAILTGVAAAAGQGYFFFTIPSMIPSAGVATLWVAPPWLVYIVFYLLLTLLLVFLTTRRIAKISNF